MGIDLAKARCLRLTERALAGDIRAAIQWLATYGGEHYAHAYRSMVDDGLL
jgi:hypothetical protein